MGKQTVIMETACSLKTLGSNYQAATLSYRTRTQYDSNKNIHFTGEITLHVAQTVNTEQLQHCIPYKMWFESGI
jgi:hypothetical protein